MASTPRYFDRLTSQALWFFGGGVLMVLGAALNLLNRAYGHLARGLRLVCVGTNIVLIVFAVVLGRVSGGTVGQWIVVLGILGFLTVLSLSRRVLVISPVDEEFARRRT
jgi:hypothetical protein